MKIGNIEIKNGDRFQVNFGGNKFISGRVVTMTVKENNHGRFWVVEYLTEQSERLIWDEYRNFGCVVSVNDVPAIAEKFWSPYETISSQGKDVPAQEHIGKRIISVSDVDKSTYDVEEVGPMYNVVLEDGTELMAFPEEVEEFLQVRLFRNTYPEGYYKDGRWVAGPTIYHSAFVSPAQK